MVLDHPQRKMRFLLLIGSRKFIYSIKHDDIIVGWVFAMQLGLIGNIMDEHRGCGVTVKSKN